MKSQVKIEKKYYTYLCNEQNETRNMDTEEVKIEEQASPVEETVEQNQVPEFDFNVLNEKYKEFIGEDPLNEDSFKDLIGSKSKISEYEQRLLEKEQEIQGAMEFKTKYESVLSSLDPAKISPNKEILALSQLAEKHKDADISVLTKIRKSDLSTMNHLDGLVLAAKLNTKTSSSDAVVREEILRDLKIEVDSLDDLTENERFRIERQFSKEKGILQEIKDFQGEGNDFDIEAEIKGYNDKKAQSRTDLENYNKEALNILFDTFKETKTVVKDDKGNDVELKYVVDGKFKENFFNEALKSLTDSGVKITNQNASDINAQIDQAYKTANFNNILQDAVKQMVSRQKEETHKEIHNDSPTNKTEAPTPTKTEVLPLRESLKNYKK